MSALGFRVTVTKWLSLVRLLLGEVPEHSEFTAPGLAEPLAAYFSIAQAVRSGDLTAFRHGACPQSIAVSTREQAEKIMTHNLPVSASAYCCSNLPMTPPQESVLLSRPVASAMVPGTMCKCREVAEKDAAEFTSDKTRNLIVRLQFNVIRAGLRRINLAYSRISLADVATRLGDSLWTTSSPAAAMALSS